MTNIRRRDFERYGSRISCGKPVSSWREFNAGHFIPAGSGDLLFYLMNVMSTVSARTTTPSMARTSSFTEEGWMLDMALGLRRA
jgi:hypothetical protein